MICVDFIVVWLLFLGLDRVFVVVCWLVCLCWMLLLNWVCMCGCFCRWNWCSGNCDDLGRC